MSCCCGTSLQLFYLLSVCCFIVAADEAHYSCVISELDDEVGFRLANAVVGEQSEQQRTEHAALGCTFV